MTSLQTLLIVEDDADLRRMFRTALAFEGFDTEEAPDGYVALHLIDQFRPVAILLDLGLPHVNGYVVLQELAARAHTRDIPVIIVTAMEVDQDLDGAVCVLHKPVTPDRLVRTVKNCIAARAGAMRTV